MVTSFVRIQVELFDRDGRRSSHSIGTIDALLATVAQKLLKRLRLYHFSWFNHSLRDGRLLLLWLDHDCSGLILVQT